MNVIIQTLGSAGDVHPFVALGRALRARGHAISVIANDHYRDVVTGAGLEFVSGSTEDDYRRLLQSPDVWHPVKGLRLVLREGLAVSLRSAIDAIRTRIVSGRTIVVGSSLGFAARIVRELEDVPLVTAHLAPAAFRSVHRAPKLPGLWMPDGAPAFYKRFLWRLSDAVIAHMIGPEFAAVRRDLGLPREPRPFDRWVHSPDRVLALFPAWFFPLQPDWPANTLLTGFPLFDDGDRRPQEGELARWLDAGSPPILVTAGSANWHGRHIYAAVITVAARLNRRVLAVTQARDVLPRELPAHVRHVEYVPFGQVLPRCSALVSHGGIGTTAQALAAGVPHIVTAMAFDQFDNATRIEELGAGALLASKRVDPESMERALRYVLEAPELETACAAIRTRMSGEDSLTAAARAVEETRRTPAS